MPYSIVKLGQLGKDTASLSQRSLFLQDNDCICHYRCLFHQLRPYRRDITQELLKSSYQLTCQQHQPLVIYGLNK